MLHRTRCASIAHGLHAVVPFMSGLLYSVSKIAKHKMDA